MFPLTMVYPANARIVVPHGYWEVRGDELIVTYPDRGFMECCIWASKVIAGHQSTLADPPATTEDEPVTQAAMGAEW